MFMLARRRRRRRRRENFVSLAGPGHKTRRFIATTNINGQRRRLKRKNSTRFEIKKSFSAKNNMTALDGFDKKESPTSFTALSACKRKQITILYVPLNLASLHSLNEAACMHSRAVD